MFDVNEVKLEFSKALGLARQFGYTKASHGDLFDWPEDFEDVEKLEAQRIEILKEIGCYGVQNEKA
jgi:hypothetical protein